MKRANADVRAKNAVRQWVLDALGGCRSVYEAYGPGGAGTRFYADAGLECSGTPHGTDAIVALEALRAPDHDVFDIDPYGNPFTALVRVAERAVAPRLGLYLTDGCMMQMAKIRGHLPREVVAVMREEFGWSNPTDWKDAKRRWDRAWISNHYPDAVRLVLERILAPRYRLIDMRIATPRPPAIARYIGAIAGAA